MAEIKDVVREIAEQIRNRVEGIRRVPEAPPESNDVFPFVVVYPLTGEYDLHTPEDMVGLHSINIELHVARKDLARDFGTLVDIMDDIPRELLDALTDGDIGESSSDVNLSTFGAINYTFGALEWAGVETLGVTYTINEVKVKANL